VESLASLSGRRSSPSDAPPSSPGDPAPTLAPAEVERVWREAVAMAKSGGTASNALLQLMAEASPLDCREGQFRVAFPPEKSKLIAWLKRRDREAVEGMLREASGFRLRVAIVEEAVSIPVRTLSAPLVDHPSAPSAFQRALGEARPAPSTGATRPAPSAPVDAGRDSSSDSLPFDPFPSDPFPSDSGSGEAPLPAGDDSSEYASPDYDEEYMKRVSLSYGAPGKRLEAILSANPTLREAVELARQTLKGSIVKFNGESLERESRE